MGAVKFQRVLGLLNGEGDPGSLFSRIIQYDPQARRCNLFVDILNEVTTPLRREVCVAQFVSVSSSSRLFVLWLFHIIRGITFHHPMGVWSTAAASSY